MFLLLVISETQKLRIRNTRHFDRILKRHEHAFARTLVRRHLEQVAALVKNLARGHFILRMSGEHLRQRRLAGTIRSHDGVNLALVNRQVDALEYFSAIDPCV